MREYAESATKDAWMADSSLTKPQSILESEVHRLDNYNQEAAALLARLETAVSRLGGSWPQQGEVNAQGLHPVSDGLIGQLSTNLSRAESNGVRFAELVRRLESL